MKNKTIVSLLLLSLCALSCKDKGNDSPIANFPCENGLASNIYECSNIDLYSVVSATDLGGENLNDIWGWTDSQTNIEYALVGLTDGISFVDVTDPNNPIVIGKLNESSIASKFKIPVNDISYAACAVGIGDTEYAKSNTQASVWRDHKVYKDHLFIVSDAQAHGMQVFDLTKLRAFSGTELQFSQDALYTKIANAHNIVINEETGFAYAVGVTNADTCATGGLHMIDINDPKNPTFAGCYEDTTPPRRVSNSAYIHDAQCVIYNGPDSDYSGKEVCFSSAERSLAISDVTDKENPITLSFIEQVNMNYAHQGWLTEDQAYFLMNDELDEYNLGRTTKTYIFDVRDLDSPSFVAFYEHNTEAIDHNLYVKGDYVYATNYISGLRVLRMDDISSAELSLAAFFDTEPRTFAQPNKMFEGTWSSYPYFKSGTIIVSDINRGLFVLRPTFIE